MPGFVGHSRYDKTAKGAFVFMRTGVEYAHNGIKNLRHRLTGPALWTGGGVTGTFTPSIQYDASSSRMSIRLACSAPGTARALYRFQLPPDFGEFGADALEVVTKRNAAITSLTCSLMKSGAADAGINGVNVSPTLTNTWQLFQLTPSGTYSKRDWVTVLLEFVADTGGDEVDIADVALEYISGRGNAK